MLIIQVIEQLIRPLIFHTVKALFDIRFSGSMCFSSSGQVMLIESSSSILAFIHYTIFKYWKLTPFQTKAVGIPSKNRGYLT
jgi:hypothetical protein